MNSRMGNGESKGRVMPGAFPDKQPGKDDTYDSNVSSISSMVAESGGFRSRSDKASEPSKMSEPEEKHRTSIDSFGTTPHPYSTISLEVADVLDLWREFESAEIPLAALSPLQKLRYGMVSKQTLLATPIISQMQTLQNSRNKDISEKATEVYQRFCGIIAEGMSGNCPSGLPGSTPAKFVMATSDTSSSVANPPLETATAQAPSSTYPTSPYDTPSPLLFDLGSNDQALLEQNRRLVELNQGLFAPSNSSLHQPDNQPVSFLPNFNNYSQGWEGPDNHFDPSNSFNWTPLFAPQGISKTNNSSNSQNSGLDVPNASGITMAVLKTFTDLVAQVKTFLNLDDPDIEPVRGSLLYFYDSAISITQRLCQTGESIGMMKTDIRNTEINIEFIEKEECGPDKLFSTTEDREFRVCDFVRQLVDQETSLAAEYHKVEELQSEFMHLSCTLLEKLTQVDGRIGQKKVDEKLDDISQLRIQILAQEQDLKTTKEALQQSQNQLATAGAELKDVRNQLTTKTTDALQHNNTIQTLTDKIRKLTHDKEIELRGIKVKHEAEIGAAQAKSLRISHLEDQTRALEKQLVDLRIAKATVDREYQNLEPNMHYKEAYEQIVRERDELRSTCNDLKAERDDLEERIQNMDIPPPETLQEVEHKPDIAPQVLSSVISHPPLTEWDHLDGLKQHWENQLKRRMDALEKTRKELESMDSEINRVQGLLRPVLQPDRRQRGPNRPPSGPRAERSQSQLLDVGVEPLGSHGAPAHARRTRF